MIGCVAGGIIGVLYISKGGAAPGILMNVAFVVCAMVLGTFGELLLEVFTGPRE